MSAAGLPNAARALGLRLVRGGAADVRALSGWHYAPGLPRGIERVWTVADPGGWPVAVVALGRPAFNATWRAGPRGWRTVSRVIVDPRYRGLGLATALVRRALRSAGASRVEAPAAMGRWCPFFERAGMRRAAAPPSAADRRLAGVLRARGIDPGDLVLPTVRRRVARSGWGRRALRTWADASRALRRRARGPAGRLALLAAGRLAADRCVFVWPGVRRAARAKRRTS